MNKIHYLIYEIKNLVNGKIYIGQHITDNVDDNYRGSGHALWAAYDKYGFSNFKKTILFDFDTFDEMNDKERELVNLDFIKRDDTYNIILGGRRGIVQTFFDKEKKQKMRDKMSQNKVGNLNGMYKKIWIVNYTTGVNKAINYGEEIPEGFVRGRCFDFSKKHGKICYLKEIEERKQQKLQMYKTYYSKAVSVYNEFGFDKMCEIFGYHKTRTNFFTMARQYSDIPLIEVNKSNYIRGKKQSVYTMKTRHMSKDERIKFYEEVYGVYKDGGFDAVVKKYDYPNTRNALLGCFKAYVSDYVPTKCNRWG